MLAAQVLVVVAALELRTTSLFEYLLWAFDDPVWNGGEWNIQSTLASAQLAVVGGVALMTARHTDRGRAERLYLAGIALVFLIIALVEYLSIHEFVDNWGDYYRVLGVAIAIATTFVAFRMPKRSWKWHGSLFAGLAMSAAGAMLVGTFWLPCNGRLGFLQFDGCMKFYFWEEALEFLGIWLTLGAILGHYSVLGPAQLSRTRRQLYSLPALWMLFIFLYALSARVEVRLLAESTKVDFESGESLRGFRVDSGRKTVLVRLYASARQKDFYDVGYSIHLVDQVSGESVAFRDEYATRQHVIWLFGPDFMPVYRQWMEVDIRPQTWPNRAFWIVLTLWRKQDDGYPRHKVLDSDLFLLSDTQVVLAELALPGDSPAPLAAFNNGFTLDAAHLPPRTRAGEILSVTFSWRSDASGKEDHVQFLHFGHAESGDWWVYDQQPLGPRLPARLWYDGLADREVWHVLLPRDLAPGRYNLFTGLYRIHDRERVPANGAEGKAFLDARVPLGTLIVE